MLKLLIQIGKNYINKSENNFIFLPDKIHFPAVVQWYIQISRDSTSTDLRHIVDCITAVSTAEAKQGHVIKLL